MKRLLSIILLLALIICGVPNTLAANDNALEAASSLYELGLFSGTGKDKNGNPIYSLDSIPTRNQAVAMLVRLLGKAGTAESETWETPFTDVVKWAKPYVGYAYENGLTVGTSKTTYGGELPITPNQYLTFTLRALGYISGVDFEYSKAWEFSDRIGLTTGEYNDDTKVFTRADIVTISYNALSCTLKGTDGTLINQLLSDGVVSLYAVEKVGLLNKTERLTLEKPVNLHVETIYGDPCLVWDTSKESVSNYDVYISTTEDGEYKYFFSPSKNYLDIMALAVYEIFELRENTTYYFKVRAENGMKSKKNTILAIFQTLSGLLHRQLLIQGQKSNHLLKLQI